MRHGTTRKVEVVKIGANERSLLRTRFGKLETDHLCTLVLELVGITLLKLGYDVFAAIADKPLSPAIEFNMPWHHDNGLNLENLDSYDAPEPVSIGLFEDAIGEADRIHYPKYIELDLEFNEDEYWGVTPLEQTAWTCEESIPKAIESPKHASWARDYWEKGPKCWIRHHCRPRTAMFMPSGTKDGPPIQELSGIRSTKADYVSGKGAVINDCWLVDG